MTRVLYDAVLSAFSSRACMLVGEDRSADISLVPGQDVWKTIIETPQQGVAHAGEATEQAQIELPVAGIPTEVAGCSRAFHHRHEPACRKLAKVAAAKGVARFTQELYRAERAAAQRVHGARPAVLARSERVPDIGCQDTAIQSPSLHHSDA